MSIKRCTLYLSAMLSVVLVMPVFAEVVTSGDSLQAVVGADGKQSVEILGGDYFFKPNHIIVKANVPVELSVKREQGIVPHTFVMKVSQWGVVIDESLDIDAKTFAFTPTTAGKYTFYCRNKLSNLCSATGYYCYQPNSRHVLHAFFNFGS